MTRRERRHFVEEAPFVKGYEAIDKPIGHSSRFGRYRMLRPKIRYHLKHGLKHDQTGDQRPACTLLFPCVELV